MNQIYKSEFQEIWQEPNTAYLKVVWLHQPQMTDEQYRTELLAQLNAIRQQTPQKMLIDCIQFDFKISADTQDWASKNIFPPSIMIGVKKVAVLSSKYFLSQISIEHNMQKESSGKMRTRYFDNESKAKEWLEV